MESPQHDKFERAKSVRNTLPGSMFNSVAELLSWRDLEIPAPSYDSLFTTWAAHAEQDISSFMLSGTVELDDKEEESFQVGKQIGFHALEKFLAKAKTIGWISQTPEHRLAFAKHILSRPQIPQRTKAWYEQGKDVLTASEFAKLFGSPRCVSQLVLSKVSTPGGQQQTNRLACMTCEMGPFDWGIRFEPVVKQILTEKWGADIAETGRITHPTDPHIAASPDGIFLGAANPARIGRLVEIKCPLTRKVGEGIPFEYWCQMQLQMEVTGVGECDYVEVKLESSLDLSGNIEGYVLLIQNPTTCEMRYAYTEEEMSKMNGWDLIEKIPWRLQEMYWVTVSRDSGWYKSTEDVRNRFWENVVKAREGQFQAVAGKTVIVTKEPAHCLITD
jgi:hypothetical protein